MMLESANFNDCQNEISFDLLSSSRGCPFHYNLKMEKHSQLEELVKKSSEYYVDNKGCVCSKRFSRDHLKSIRYRIHR